LEENNFVNIELTKDCDSVDRVVSAVFLAWICSTWFFPF
jgi:hypothetical protein